MDLLSLSKNLGGVLATITTVVYVSGYLALRARAFTLGTDPGFALVYEGYVFAGFRFALLSLLSLLLLTPAILLVRSAAYNIFNRLPANLVTPLEWLLLSLWALTTIFVTLWVLSLNGVLLQGKSASSDSLLERAVLGGEMAEIITFAALFLTALSIFWLRRHLSDLDDPFTWVLLAVVALEIFLLPILHGSLYADRKVRVLAATPGAVKGVGEPLGIVDRSSDHVTLLGLDENGERRLVTIKLEDLNGIPIQKIVSLNKFLENDLAHAQRKKEGAMPGNKAVDSGKNLLKEVMTKLHMAFENVSSLGESVVEDGGIWSVELDAAGTPAKPGQIGAANNFSWPVFDPRQRVIYAIQQGRIFKMQDGKETVIEGDKQKHWLKLLGVTEDGDILGVVKEDSGNVLAILHSNGEVTPISTPADEEVQEWESSLTGENHVYSGQRGLYVDRSARGGRGFDVFFRSGEKVVNVSNCGDDQCGQPSLSPDFRRILYIRKAAY